MQESQLRPLRVKNGREPGDTSGGETLSPLLMLLFGAASGACAEAVVYPMEVVRRRLQVQAASAGSAGDHLCFWRVSCIIRCNRMGNLISKLLQMFSLRC